MISPWHNPLPLAVSQNQRVVVYFYSGKWVPIMFYSLDAAIELHRQAQLRGQELFVFPSNSSPNEFDALTAIVPEVTNEVSHFSICHKTDSRIAQFVR